MRIIRCDRCRKENRAERSNLYSRIRLNKENVTFEFDLCNDCTTAFFSDFMLPEKNGAPSPIEKQEENNIKRKNN